MTTPTDAAPGARRVPPAPAGFSPAALERLHAPRTRGAFRPIDAARRQLGLLAVADAGGECRLTWLIDLATQRIADARFLAFGSLASHPLADAFTEQVRGRSVSDACALPPQDVERSLREHADVPAVPGGAAAAGFLADAQRLALAALPSVVLLPRPAERVAYQRKRELDWTPADRTWFGLSYLKRIARAETVIAEALRTRADPMLRSEITGLHDDFRITLRLHRSGDATVSPVETATLARMFDDALRSSLHADLTVEIA